MLEDDLNELIKLAGPAQLPILPLAPKTAGTKRGKDMPPDEQELKKGRALIQTAKKARSLEVCRWATLAALCTERNISFETGNSKAALINQIQKWVSRCAVLAIPFLMAKISLVQRTLHKIIDEEGYLVEDPDENIATYGVVLGREILLEIWSDQATLTVPAYVTCGPNKLGTTDQKMTADRRRAVGTIHLVITLIRLWGNEQGRKKEMLKNYMHLITALQIASPRQTTKEHGSLYTFHYTEYLKGYVELYKEASVKPNNHLCLHLEIFLRRFGPVHSWRAWVFERFNYLLQNLNTNSKFGEYRQRTYHVDLYSFSTLF